MNINLRLIYKIWLEENDKAFGEGPYELLKRIHRLGSLNKSVKEMDMSYSKGWSMVKRSEKELGFSLLERKTGGLEGGGCSLTPEALELMSRYGKFSDEVDKVVTLLYERYLYEIFL